MASSNDGFVIAEKDLELRARGMFWCKAAWSSRVQVANLYRDMDVLKDVQKAAKHIVSEV